MNHSFFTRFCLLGTYASFTKGGSESARRRILSEEKSLHARKLAVLPLKKGELKNVLFRTIASKICATAGASMILLLLMFSVLGFFTPVSAEIGSSDPAQSGFQLVPCDPTKADQPCDYNAFITGIQRIIKACILFAIPLAAGVFGWAGIKMMMAGGSTKERDEAKEMMWKVLKGMLLMLSAWYIVDLALDGLLSPTFKSGLQ